MKRIALILIISLFVVFDAAAQGLTGTVTDDGGQPLPFANVAVLSARDSVLTGGAVTGDDGRFTLDNVSKGSILRVSSVGYNTAYKVYDGTAGVTIVLHEDTRLLGEVVVKSQLPKTMLKGEGMITTVAGSVLEKTVSMEQLLDRIPTVTVLDGEIEVFGRGTPEIYINGRKMRDRMELDNLKPDEIKSVEVINNPGARYDASVKCVIRIMTKKREGEGWSVDTETKIKLDEQKNTGWTENINTAYRTGKWETSLQLYGAYTRTPDDKRLEQVTFLEDTWRQTNGITQTYTNLNPYVRMATSYMADADNFIGASVSCDRYAKRNGEGDIDGRAVCNGIQTEQSQTHVDSPGKSTSVTTNAYYVGKIGKLGIDFNNDFYWFESDNRMHNAERYAQTGAEETVRDVRSDRKTDNRLIASKLVLSLPVMSGSLSVGGEYSYSRRKSVYNLLPKGIVDDENSLIKENFTSVFADYGITLGKLSLRAGLRYEYVDFNYYDSGVRKPGQSKTYGDWFPSASLSMPVGKTQMQLTYASDIYRPSYFELRDGIQFDNRYTYESGNPFLVPSVSRNLGYALSWKWLSFSTMYTHISDEICSLMYTYEGDPQSTLAKPENMPSYDNVQATVSLNPSFGVWHPSLEVMLFKEWFKMETHEGSILDNPVGVFQMVNTLDFPWLTASLTFTAQTEGNMGNKFVRKGYFCTDLSLYKSFMHDRLVIQLYANDLLGTADAHRSFYSGKQRTTLLDSYSTSAVTLTVRYRFNVSKNRYKGTGAGQSQRSRM